MQCHIYVQHTQTHHARTHMRAHTHARTQIRTHTRDHFAVLTFSPHVLMDRCHFNFTSSPAAEFAARERSCAHKQSTGKLVCVAFIISWRFKLGFVKRSAEREPAKSGLSNNTMRRNLALSAVVSCTGSGTNAAQHHQEFYHVWEENIDNSNSMLMVMFYSCRCRKVHHNRSTGVSLQARSLCSGLRTIVLLLINVNMNFPETFHARVISAIAKLCFITKMNIRFAVLNVWFVPYIVII